MTDHIKEQIQKLRFANLTFEGWNGVINNYDETDDFSQFAVFDIRIKSFYLQNLFIKTLEHYDTTYDFKDIAAMSLSETNIHLNVHGTDRTNLRTIKSHYTLLKWFRSYRDKDGFPNSSKLSSAKSKLPYFLYSNPDVCDEILSFCKTNISTLSGELVHTHLHECVLPTIVKTIQEERKDETYNEHDLFKEFRLKSLTMMTVYNWMHHLGMRYESRRKCYYVDSHEKPENVTYRKEFISRYFDYELCSHRWVQISCFEREKMIKDGELDSHLGYKYLDSNVEIWEYHVDDHLSFQERCNTLPYGGNLSVRKPHNQKPTLILGQDECIFKQFVFTKGNWLLPDGTKQLIPKDEGQGVMLSSFTSRELGYGYEITQDILDEINMKRNNTSYSDTDAAKLKNGTTIKPLLTESPFTRELEYGLNNEGYWTYESMVLQLEDCIDVLTHTHPQFQYVFLFDHSNGHDRLQPQGLSITKISMRHGGKQPYMRKSKLSSVDFGPFHNSTYPLQPGMEQSMQYCTDDEGPCYFTKEERLNRKYDIKSGRRREGLLVRKVLRDNLIKAGLVNPTGTRKELQEQSIRLGLPIKNSSEVISDGWHERQKGALQILFERGWICPDFIQHYTLDGKKENRSFQSNGRSDKIQNSPTSSAPPEDPTGCNYSIKSILKLQSDFTNELTLLQFHGNKLGVVIDRTPKCHPEIAGEGI